MQEHSQGTYYPMRPVKSNTATAFVYAIQFSGVNPVGTCALVVALNPEQAIKAFKNKLFTYNHALYESNTMLPTSAATVFCQADNSQLGKVQIINDGEY